MALETGCKEATIPRLVGFARQEGRRMAQKTGQILQEEQIANKREGKVSGVLSAILPSYCCFGAPSLVLTLYLLFVWSWSLGGRSGTASSTEFQHSFTIDCSSRTNHVNGV